MMRAEPYILLETNEELSVQMQEKIAHEYQPITTTI
jgi:hypothetical protein